MNIELLGLIAAISFLIAAFFAGSETAIIALDRVRLRHKANRGDVKARLLLRYVHNPEYLLSLVLVGTNLGKIGCTTTFTAIMIHYFGTSGTTIATLILVPSLLIFQEILPKGIFLYYPNRTSFAAIYPLRFFAGVLYPIVKAFAGLMSFLLRVFRIRKMDPKVRMTMEELLFHLESSQKAGAIGADTVTLASRAIGIAAVVAKDVMLPLDRVVMAEEGRTIDQYRRIFARERFSRLPIYRGDRQNVVGILSIHSLLVGRQAATGALAVEAPYVVSAQTPVAEIMVRMQNYGSHTAMVSDEHGRIIGMATLEDILERLVGALADEFH
jgi:putative hemolysin